MWIQNIQKSPAYTDYLASKPSRINYVMFIVCFCYFLPQSRYDGSRVANKETVV